MRTTRTTIPRYALMKNNYRRRLELHTLEVLQTPSVGEVCECPKVSSLLNSYLVLKFVYVLTSCSKKWKKNERSCHGDNIESSSTNHHGKYSQCPAFDIKQSPTGRSPEDHQVCTHSHLLLNNAWSCFHASFICSRMLWFECVMHNTFMSVLNQAWCLG